MTSHDESDKRIHYLKIEHINAQSVQGNIDVIRFLLNKRKVDILCVSETWLTPGVPNKYVNVTDYNIFRRDLKPGGGVCIYVRSDLKVREITLAIDSEALVEDLWIQVQYNKLPSIIISTIYRHQKL